MHDPKTTEPAAEQMHQEQPTVDGDAKRDRHVAPPERHRLTRERLETEITRAKAVILGL